MPYIGKVEEGLAMTMDAEFIKTWTFKVYWKSEADGKLDEAFFSGSCSRRDPKTRKRLEVKLGRDVQSFISYAQRKGVRYEVMRREKAERKRAKARAVFLAKEKMRGAAPDLLAATKAMLANAANAGELAKAAIAKAEG